MPKLEIKGWETGFNKLKMTELLIEKLMLDKTESEKMVTAISGGQAISLDIEDETLANDLYEGLLGYGALVKIE